MPQSQPRLRHDAKSTQELKAKKRPGLALSISRAPNVLAQPQPRMAAIAAIAALAALAALGMRPQWPDVLSTHGSYWMEYLGDGSMLSRMFGLAGF